MYAICMDVIDILNQGDISFVSLGAKRGKAELRAVDAHSRDVTDTLHPAMQVSILSHLEELLSGDGIVSFRRDDPALEHAFQGSEEAYLSAASCLSDRLQQTLFH